MKKYLLFLTVSLLLFVSCSALKTGRQQRNLISGTWSLDDIRYENNEGTFQVTLFNDADAICFEGSDWFFRDNNSTGRYTLNEGSLCSGGDRYIRWSVVDREENYEDQLQFKFIDEDNKDIGGGQGYRLNIAALSAESMTLKSRVEVDGEPITIVYEFSKK